MLDIDTKQKKELASHLNEIMTGTQRSLRSLGVAIRTPAVIAGMQSLRDFFSKHKITTFKQFIALFNELIGADEKKYASFVAALFVKHPNDPQERMQTVFGDDKGAMKSFCAIVCPNAVGTLIAAFREADDKNRERIARALRCIQSTGLCSPEESQEIDLALNMYAFITLIWAADASASIGDPRDISDDIKNLYELLKDKKAPPFPNAEDIDFILRLLRDPEQFLAAFNNLEDAQDFLNKAFPNLVGILVTAQFGKKGTQCRNAFEFVAEIIYKGTNNGIVAPALDALKPGLQSDDPETVSRTLLALNGILAIGSKLFTSDQMQAVVEVVSGYHLKLLRGKIDKEINDEYIKILAEFVGLVEKYAKYLDSPVTDILIRNFLAGINIDQRKRRLAALGEVALHHPALNERQQALKFIIGIAEGKSPLRETAQNVLKNLAEYADKENDIRTLDEVKDAKQAFIQVIVSNIWSNLLDVYDGPILNGGNIKKLYALLKEQNSPPFPYSDDIKLVSRLLRDDFFQAFGNDKGKKREFLELAFPDLINILVKDSKDNNQGTPSPDLQFVAGLYAGTENNKAQQALQDLETFRKGKKKREQCEALLRDIKLETDFLYVITKLKVLLKSCPVTSDEFYSFFPNEEGYYRFIASLFIDNRLAEAFKDDTMEMIKFRNIVVCKDAIDKLISGLQSDDSETLKHSALALHCILAAGDELFTPEQIQTVVNALFQYRSKLLEGKEVDDEYIKTLAEFVEKYAKHLNLSVTSTLTQNFVRVNNDTKNTVLAACGEVALHHLDPNERKKALQFIIESAKSPEYTVQETARKVLQKLAEYTDENDIRTPDEIQEAKQAFNGLEMKAAADKIKSNDDLLNNIKKLSALLDDQNLPPQDIELILALLGDEGTAFFQAFDNDNEKMRKFLEKAFPDLVEGLMDYYKANNEDISASALQFVADLYAGTENNKAAQALQDLQVLREREKKLKKFASLLDAIKKAGEKIELEELLKQHQVTIAEFFAFFSSEDSKTLHPLLTGILATLAKFVVQNVSDINFPVCNVLCVGLGLETTETKRIIEALEAVVLKHNDLDEQRKAFDHIKEICCDKQASDEVKAAAVAALENIAKNEDRVSKNGSRGYSLDPGIRKEAIGVLINYYLNNNMLDELLQLMRLTKSQLWQKDVSLQCISDTDLIKIVHRAGDELLKNDNSTNAENILEYIENVYSGAPKTAAKVELGKYYERRGLSKRAVSQYEGLNEVERRQLLGDLWYELQGARDLVRNKLNILNGWCNLPDSKPFFIDYEEKKRKWEQALSEAQKSFAADDEARRQALAKLKEVSAEMSTFGQTVRDGIFSQIERDIIETNAQNADLTTKKLKLKDQLVTAQREYNEKADNLETARATHTTLTAELKGMNEKHAGMVSISQKVLLPFSRCLGGIREEADRISRKNSGWFLGGVEPKGFMAKLGALLRAGLSKIGFRQWFKKIADTRERMINIKTKLDSFTRAKTYQKYVESAQDLQTSLNAAPGLGNMIPEALRSQVEALPLPPQGQEQDHLDVTISSLAVADSLDAIATQLKQEADILVAAISGTKEQIAAALLKLGTAQSQCETAKRELDELIAKQAEQIKTQNDLDKKLADLQTKLGELSKHFTQDNFSVLSSEPEITCLPQEEIQAATLFEAQLMVALQAAITIVVTAVCAVVAARLGAEEAKKVTTTTRYLPESIVSMHRVLSEEQPPVQRQQIEEILQDKRTGDKTQGPEPFHDWVKQAQEAHQVSTDVSDHRLRRIKSSQDFLDVVYKVVVQQSSGTVEGVKEKFDAAAQTYADSLSELLQENFAPKPDRQEVVSGTTGPERIGGDFSPENHPTTVSQHQGLMVAAG